MSQVIVLNISDADLIGTLLMFMHDEFSRMASVVLLRHHDRPGSRESVTLVR